MRVLYNLSEDSDLTPLMLVVLAFRYAQAHLTKWNNDETLLTFVFTYFRVANKLLACSSEVLTLNALKLIGKVLHHSTSK